jgi:hypothetical protein
MRMGKYRVIHKVNSESYWSEGSWTPLHHHPIYNPRLIRAQNFWWRHLGTLHRKSHLCIPRKEIARLQSQFLHSCVCEQFIIPRIDPHIFLLQKRQIDGWNIQIAHRQTDREWGRTIPFLGIFVLNFRYCVLSVYSMYSRPRLFFVFSIKLPTL